MKNESGRSLIEMLGILAIMGILSLVSVKAYNSAMNRHRANELVYEAQKRATIVAMQIAGGRDTLSIGEFTNPEEYTFSVRKENEKQFVLTLDGVDPDICIQMRLHNESGPVCKISENCHEIIFNNDLSSTNEALCIEAGKIWCASTGLCSDTGTCCGNKDCSASDCPDGSSTEGEGGTTGVFKNGVECKCPTQTVYNGSTCITQPASCSDWAKNECGFGYYCDFTYQEEINYLGTDTDCYQKLKGTCKKITSTPPTEAQLKILTDAGFKSTFVRGGTMYWWSANSWCLGQGKRLIEVSDMQCNYKQGKQGLSVQEGDEGRFECCKKGMTCQIGWSNLWNNKEVISGKEEDVAKFNDKIVALKKVYGGTYFWLASAYKNMNQNSCKAFYAYTHDGGYVFGRDRFNKYIPLCQ